MKNVFYKKRLSFLLKVVALLLIFLLPLSFSAKKGDFSVNASAAGADVMRIDRYDVTATVRQDRQIEFQETIVMTPQKAGSVFTRYLPLEGDRYYNISASCLGEDEEFSYYVETDEDDYYLCVNCTIPSAVGQTRVYEISYVMEIGTDDVKNGMSLDIIGYGWGVALHNVTATLRFPAEISASDFTLYSGGYGSEDNAAGVVGVLSQDGKTLTLTAETLDRVYNSTYGEYMAEGITVRFTLPEGALDGFLKTRIFTEDMWKILLCGGAIVALAFYALFLTRKKREIISVVNIKAPDDMDPMRMGRLLDGEVDNEDVTSMIYYFAHRGYLTIDLSDENDPVLIKKVDSLPENSPAHQKTLFNGLFAFGETASVSSLKNKFYQSVEIAEKQVLGMPMYEKKSVLGYILGGLFGVAFGLLAPLIMSVFKIGGGYGYMLGIVFALPVGAILFIGAIRENYRYKWKKKTYTLVCALQAIIAIVSAFAFTFAFARHVMTEYEKFVTAAIVFSATFVTQSAMSRTEKYCDILGEILGFKDFIVVTEEDKIKFMLEEDPELYYKVLPYAQVLGVTNEWENKFANILIEPPQWCTGMQTTYFDYLILNRCIMRGMVIAMARPRESGNGSFAGRSGGGGGFGGFGGGGHGGGGGGWR